MRNNKFETNDFTHTDIENSELSSELSTKTENRRNRRAGNRRKVVKKVSALALSAILFGGLAAGTFQDLPGCQYTDHK